MEYFLLILAFALLALTAYLYARAQNVLRQVNAMKDEISQVKNIGDLLSVTENTLDEAGRAINTAKRLMDGRIRRMEELLEEIDSRLPDLERRVKSISASQKTHQQITAGGYETESYQKEKAADPDREEREIIARRNKRIIVMLEEGLSLEEIARQTGASMREIKLIQKFIK